MRNLNDLSYTSRSGVKTTIQPIYAHYLTLYLSSYSTGRIYLTVFSNTNSSITNLTQIPKSVNFNSSGSAHLPLTGFLVQQSSPTVYTTYLPTYLKFTITYNSEGMEVYTPRIYCVRIDGSSNISQILQEQEIDLSLQDTSLSDFVDLIS